ncbi:hypothetical protein BGZ83_002726 [Gryganskiella cystojenkinii]|nr:hypothetical protein BGZ83_002726 [Gryganskiella cystojenkinii]
MAPPHVAQNRIDDRVVIQDEIIPRTHFGPHYVPMDFTIKDIRGAIPARLFVRDTTKSVMYALKDLVTIAAIFYCGRECGHRAFSSSKMNNTIFGWIFHSVLLIPRQALQISHSRHHKGVGTVSRDVMHVPTRSYKGLPPPNEMVAHGETAVGQDHRQYDESVFAETPLYTVTMLFFIMALGFPMYLLTNFGGHDAPHWVSHFQTVAPLVEPHQARDIFCSNCGIAAMLSILTYFSMVYSPITVFMYYGIPYLVVNAWVFCITFLHYNDRKAPRFRDDAWNFQHGAALLIDRTAGS